MPLNAYRLGIVFVSFCSIHLFIYCHFSVRISVVQATKSARRSAFLWYLGIAFCILFFGGFLAKSYWEEFVFERDTRKLLAYYKHVIPGAMSDGDLHVSTAVGTPLLVGRDCCF
jgi:hypothetical protein